MEDKRRSLLIVGLVLVLATSVAACNKPATITQSPRISVERPFEPAAIQPTPRTLTQTGASLFMPLKVGERVEIEADTLPSNKPIFSVFDPYGNKVGSSATMLKAASDTSRVPMEWSIQEYPWHYAFIAATDGEYVVTIAKSLKAAKESEERVLKGISVPVEGYTFTATIYP